MKKYFLIYLLLVIPMMVFPQSIDTKFGKNRVQYHDDFTKWDKYETENFITYWYGKGRNVAEIVIPMAEYFHNRVQNILEHRMNDKIKIIVYTDISDLKQSNIGNDDTWTSANGETKIVGNKMFVYFDGNHQNLEVQLREGIASVYLSSMLFGSSFQEIVQNAVLLHLPEWYKQGIISYAGSNWDLYIEDEVRDILERDDKYWEFEKFADDHPRAAGHAMWYFISQYYSPSSIPNLLYLTKISRDLKESFLYVLSESQETIFSEWEIFFREYYQSEEGRYVPPSPENELDLKNKDHVPVSLLRFSPDGQYLAYVYNEIGKYRVMVRDLTTGKENTIFKYGYKNAIQETDYNYPLLTWHPDNQSVTIAYEHRDVIKLRKINVADSDQYQEQIIPEEYHRLYSISYLDETHYVFSASTDGYSDLYYYDSDFRTTERLTEDYYDDLDAEVTTYDGKRGILFSSNRTVNHIVKTEFDTILPLSNFDLFFYEIEEDNKDLIRITNTGKVNERQPFTVGRENMITFIADRSGIKNSYVHDPFSGRSYAISNLNRNLIFHHGIADSDKYIYMLYFDGAYRIFTEEKDWTKPIITSFTPLQRSLSEEDVIIPLAPEEEEEEEMKEGYKFISRFDDPPVIPELKDDSREEQFLKDLFIQDEVIATEQKGLVEFNSARITASRLTFRLDNFTTKLDNQVLFEGLESYSGEPDQLDYNPNGLLIKGTVKDLLEDYVFEGGVRIPTSFDGTEYFLVFDDKKDLIDKRYAIYRKTNTDYVDESTFPAQRSKKNALIGLYQLRYPFDVYRSIRATTTLRFDKFYFQSAENNSFNEPFTNEKRLGLKLEYVYDNTIDIDENLKHGTRYKFYAEAINRFNFEFVDGFNVDLSNGYTTVVGFDFRHYIPFLRYSILAFRGAGAMSMGSEKIMYYLGGTNGWVFQKFNQTTPVPENTTFAYKTAANQLRGFNYNIRNGASYALSNIEWRIPLFKYIKGRNLKSSFLRNFQVVGFFDAGLAWHGLDPLGSDNPLNKQTVSSPPIITVEVEYFRDPLVMGYGFGLRTRLLGYNMKFDYAWGIETRQVRNPKFYFSLGTDF